MKNKTKNEKKTISQLFAKNIEVALVSLLHASLVLTDGC